MNVPLQKVVAVLALSGMCFAQAGTTGSAAPKKKTTTKTRVAAKPAATAEEVQQLREMLQQQQQTLQQLQQQMAQRDQQLQQTQQQLSDAQNAAKDAQAKAAAVESTANESKEGVAKVKSDLDDVRGTMTSQVLTAQEDQKKVDALSGEIKRLRFTGDIRVRYENFFQQNTADRNRERIRLRFGVEGKLGEDFVGGLFIASGVITDPTSTNETLTNVFEKKTVGFDRGYVTYNPHYFKPLSITGGKFAYTWNRTPITFDSDLNPEGFTQKLSFDVKSPFVKNLTFQGIQMLFNESGSGADSYAVGGQVSSKLQLGNWWTMTPSYTMLNWHNDDIILNEPTGVTGGTTVGPFAPNGMTNCTVTVGANKAFCSKFLYSDVIVANVFKTPIAKLPFNLLGEYEVNLNAANNHSHSYYVDASLGRTTNRNDFQVGYAFIRQEQDSVISSFNESDQRSPTNVVNHRVAFNWKVAKNTTLGYTQWIGHTLDPTLQNAKLAPGVSTTGTCGVGSPVNCLTKDPWLKRGQLDLVYTF
jgi:hypothetical protein